MPVIDSHVHVLPEYRPMAPFEDLGRVDRLLALMDDTGVDRAVMVPVVGADTPDNNDECAAWARQHPDRLINLVALPLDAPDAAAQAARVRDAYGGAGVSWYPPQTDPAALLQPAMEPVWEALQADSLVCSIQARPPLFAALLELARRYPAITFVGNHLGLPGEHLEPDDRTYGGLDAVGSLPNVYIKASGFYAAAAQQWDIRCPRSLAYLHSLIAAVGAERVLWGSDWPPCARHYTYRQSLEIVNTVAPLTATQRSLIMGTNAARIFTHG